MLVSLVSCGDPEMREEVLHLLMRGRVLEIEDGRLPRLGAGSGREAAARSGRMTRSRRMSKAAMARRPEASAT